MSVPGMRVRRPEHHLEFVSVEQARRLLPYLQPAACRTLPCDFASRAQVSVRPSTSVDRYMNKLTASQVVATITDAVVSRTVACD